MQNGDDAPHGIASKVSLLYCIGVVPMQYRKPVAAHELEVLIDHPSDFI